MKRGLAALPLVLCLLLSGCTSWMDGSYSSVNLHTHRQNQTSAEAAITVSSYMELRTALVEIVESGTGKALINVEQMVEDRVPSDMDRAIKYVLGTNPVGAYAAESIAYEMGTSGGQKAVAVTVTYNNNQAQIRSLKQAANMTEAQEFLTDALDLCESNVVMRVEKYQEIDFAQFVEDYADENPGQVMEVPQLTVVTYPETGTSRVVEIIFTYQSSREDLRSMQSRVRPLFTSAELYVNADASDQEKYTQLYTFLMERNDYQIDTSITPAYSLLVHGVGDSKAFATVYSAMCRRVGLACMVVSGTCNAEPLFWNIICVDGVYYHLDLLDCSRTGYFAYRTDGEMSGYVWDYSAYPACVEPEEETEPTEETEPSTEPETTE